jgi:hypothetical protein
MRIRTIFGIALAVATFTSANVAHASDPTTADCVAANEASITLRSQHKLRETREQLLVCAAPSCPEDIRVECGRRVELVNRAMPTIVFEAKDASGTDIAVVKVDIDGKPLLERLDGIAISLDPGEHRFTFTVVGQTPVEQTFVIREGEKDRRERVTFGGVRPAAPGTAPASLAEPAPVTSPPRSSGDGADGSTQRIGGLVVGGVGIVGLGLGAVFGLKASSTWSNAQAKCSATSCPDRAGALADHDSASSAATVATVSFIAGGVALAGGLALVFTAPRSGSSSSSTGGIRLTPMLGPSSASLGAGGTF